MARDLKKDFATIKQQFTRGSGWIGILISFGVITANIKLFENALMPLMPKGFAFQWLYPFAIIGYVIACYLIGWLDDHHGIWKAENNYTYEVSPYSQDMLKKINDIHTVLLGDDGK